jgi:putative LysE/RhtB family amino acid efflux pump
MQRTLRGGFRLGLASGAGVATADAIYATLAAAGIAAVAVLARDATEPLRVVGGAGLLVLGWRAWRDAGGSCEAAAAPDARGLAAAFGSALGLTLANPATILSFAALIAGLGAGVARPGDGPPFVAGIAAGSLAWWFALASAIGLARKRLSPKAILVASRVSAVVLAAAGLVVLGRVVLS